MSDTIDYKKLRDIIKEEARNAAPRLSHKTMSQIAKESSKEAVTEMLLVCGIDANNPLEMQSLMSYGKECQANAERTKKVVDWGTEAMANGVALKRGVYSELGKSIMTVSVTLFLGWLAAVKGIF